MPCIANFFYFCNHENCKMNIAYGPNETLYIA